MGWQKVRFVDEVELPHARPDGEDDFARDWGWLRGASVRARWLPKTELEAEDLYCSCQQFFVVQNPRTGAEGVACRRQLEMD
jgi:hypothetical protein